MTETNKCAICWEEIGEKNKLVTNCGHTFHFSCISTNMLKGDSDQTLNCPLCRELIVDKEFENCSVQVFHNDDTDSIPSLEEENHLWVGSQMWRRDLRVRDKVLIKTYEIDLLNSMGWDIRNEDVSQDAVNLYAQLECEVVRIAIEPHEESEGLAPFLLKPLVNYAIPRFQIQAYRPKQSEVLDIELSVGWRDQPFDPQSFVFDTFTSGDDVLHEDIIRFNRIETISKRQIHDKPIHEIMELIDEKIKSTVRNQIYTKETVRSLVHKITIDILMEHKKKQEDDKQAIEDESSPRIVRI